MRTEKTSLALLSSSFFHLFLVVILGALASHALKPLLDEEATTLWQTGLQFHAIHALGLGLLAFLPLKLPGLVKMTVFAGYLIWFGIVLFSGGLYLLALGYKTLHFLIPIGGFAWLIAWAVLFVSSFKAWLQIKQD